MPILTLFDYLLFSENKMDEDVCKLILQPILENPSLERVVLDLS